MGKKDKTQQGVAYKSLISMKTSRVSSSNLETNSKIRKRMRNRGSWQPPGFRVIDSIPELMPGDKAIWRRWLITQSKGLAQTCSASIRSAWHSMLIASLRITLPRKQLGLALQKCTPHPDWLKGALRHMLRIHKLKLIRKVRSSKMGSIKELQPWL